MKRVMVTGWAGFIGSHLTEALIAQGIEVVGVDCSPPRYGEISSLCRSRLFRPVEVDLSTGTLDSLVSGCDAVFHLAARTGTPAADALEGGFEVYVVDNIVATQRLMQACQRQRIPKVVVASSAQVYGPSIGASNEEDDCRPVSPYAVTKLAAEQLALSYARRHADRVPVVALRYFTVYGPRQRPDMAFARMLHAAITSRSYLLYGDGTPQRDYVYITDAVAATIAAARLDDHHEEVINVGSGSTISLNCAIAAVEKALGLPVIQHTVPAPRCDIPTTRADLQAARSLLGYEPTVSLARGLARQIEWLRGLDPRYLRRTTPSCP